MLDVFKEVVEVYEYGWMSDTSANSYTRPKGWDVKQQEHRT